MIQEILINALIVLYGATAFLDIFGYWPTIQDLYHHKKPSANPRSYGVWTVTTGITFLYGLFILSDALFQIVSALVFLANLTVYILVIRFRHSE